ncbi:hypothetical protein [Streptomyces sp. NBC_00259]|uniref:hypothetical protein n=1 Tax=Streptomyces sp. NBC_00259 TaxID=2903643 RepID=UPI002E29DCFB|nr:hypothetical protein [Streptomyces sp. NBC_00259]
MRLSRTLTAGVATLVALAALSGCSSDPMEDLGLPAADDIAGVERFVNSVSSCQELEPKGKLESGDVVDPADEAWGVGEKWYCHDEGGEEMALMTVTDMEKFQASLKKESLRQERENGSGGGDSALVGENFAVYPEDDDTVRDLMQGGLLLMACKEKYKAEIPSGYTVHEGPVEGCFATDFIPS